MMTVVSAQCSATITVVLLEFAVEQRFSYSGAHPSRGRNPMLEAPGMTQGNKCTYKSFINNDPILHGGGRGAYKS